MWIEQAIEPLRARLTAEQHDRLVSALAVVVGWEAMIVMQDIRGLSPEREQAVASWAARTLVRAILDEIGEPDGRT